MEPLPQACSLAPQASTLALVLAREQVRVCGQKVLVLNAPAVPPSELLAASRAYWLPVRQLGAPALQVRMMLRPVWLQEQYASRPRLPFLIWLPY